MTTNETVHPHGRGDNQIRGINAVAPDGSPPRAWGQSVFEIAVADQRRFTPTGVGTMRSTTSSSTSSAVHPHGRGDNRSGASASRGTGGSPPRAWGQCDLITSDSLFARFTPTGVGTICIRSDRGSDTTVHPHGRGDNEGSANTDEIEYGSPPRAWGQCAYG